MNLWEMPDCRPLHRSTPLARELVHRTALAEVLLTDVRRDGEHEFTAAAQWSRSHPTFDRAGDGRHNPLLVAETMRELGICVPLQFYGLPTDSHILIEELTFALDQAAEPRARYGGSEITCEVRADLIAVGRGQRGPRRLRLTVRYLAAGREFGQADGIARFLTPAAYAAVRSRRPAADDLSGNARAIAPEPARVGVANRPDLMIGLDPDGRALVLPADPYHPFFFDHVSDHVPGMVLIEAVRQVAVLQADRPGWRIAGCAFRALAFTESNPPAGIVCAIDGSVAEFEVSQSGTPTATGRLRFAAG